MLKLSVCFLFALLHYQVRPAYQLGLELASLSRKTAYQLGLEPSEPSASTHLDEILKHTSARLEGKQVKNAEFRNMMILSKTNFTIVSL